MVKTDMESFGLLLQEKLTQYSRLVVAFSGGLDSALLMLLAHKAAPGSVQGVHAHSEVISRQATQRAWRLAVAYGWPLYVLKQSLLEIGDFTSNDPRRCYVCKSHTLTNLRIDFHKMSQYLLDKQGGLSYSNDNESFVWATGTNVDDLSEDRPGLRAEREQGIWRPFVEMNWSKERLRSLARELGLPVERMPADSCLATRIKTGEVITSEKLQVVAHGEWFLRVRTDLSILRCRLTQDRMHIEVGEGEQNKITYQDLLALEGELQRRFPELSLVLEPHIYVYGKN